MLSIPHAVRTLIDLLCYAWRCKFPEQDVTCTPCVSIASISHCTQPSQKQHPVELVTFRPIMHIICRDADMLDFHALYTSYAPEVYRFAYWLAGDLAEAEDVTSETFIRAWTHVGAIRTETLKAYLLQIARNIYLERIRKQKREIRLTDAQPDHHPGPEALAEDHAELAMVQRVLQALPEIDRAAFILRVQQELPYDEIGRVLRLSVPAVKVKVHRARKKLLTARMSKEAV